MIITLEMLSYWRASLFFSQEPKAKKSFLLVNETEGLVPSNKIDGEMTTMKENKFSKKELLMKWKERTKEEEEEST